MEIRLFGGGGLWTLNSEILRAGGTQAVQEIQVEGRGLKKTVPSVGPGGGGGIFLE